MKFALPDAVTYFAPDGQDAFGAPAYAAGVEIVARWQDSLSLIRDPQGREITSSTVIYTTSAIAVGGKVALGSGASAANGREIRQVARATDLTGGSALHKGWL